MSTHTPNRVRAGVSTGGQFAPHARGESPVSLDAGADLTARVDAALASEDRLARLVQIAHEQTRPARERMDTIDAALTQVAKQIAGSRIPEPVCEDFEQDLEYWRDWRDGAQDHEANLRYDFDAALVSDDPTGGCIKAINDRVAEDSEDERALRGVVADVKDRASSSEYVGFEDSEEILHALGDIRPA